MEEIRKEDEPLNIEIPRCGQTVCDNPAVAGNYLHQWDMHALKTLRYRVVVISDDDGRCGIQFTVQN
ncbi:unnamed protein product [Gongylonema pulchrum]|uniref:Phospholipid scramblase n=1 Tax=Gongylonema pulchrum TaxID=637853 RepID=A0A183DLY1_9BILA|nr:unnamed protein product [Gongylonema pulchrum]